MVNLIAEIRLTFSFTYVFFALINCFRHIYCTAFEVLPFSLFTSVCINPQILGICLF